MLSTLVLLRLRVLRIGFLSSSSWPCCNIDHHLIYASCIDSFGEGSKLYVHHDNKPFDLKKIHVTLDNYKTYCHIWIKFEWSETNYLTKLIVNSHYSITSIVIMFWLIYCVHKTPCHIWMKLPMFAHGSDEVIIGIKAAYEHKYFGVKRRLMFGPRWWEKESQLQVYRR